jgi:hypothetical protein
MTSYQAFVTPLKYPDFYGDEIEVTDWLLSDNLGEVTRAIDSTDYDIGIYTTNDVTLVFDASDGYLNDQSDYRSMFQVSRDLAKVRVVYLKDGVPLTTFEGLINEEGTSIDAENETVSIVVMGYDSVLRKAVIPAGAVQDGFTFQQAFIAILNSVASGVLGINADNINPVYNGTVDVGTFFDNKTAKDGLDALLLPANSVLIVDGSQNVFVQGRSESQNKVLFLHGRGDLLGRENINALSNYNPGLQRTFNVVRVKGGQPPADVSGTTVSTPALVGFYQDPTSVSLYRARVKEFTVEFVTDQAALDAIAQALVQEFAYPKPECEVTLATELIQAQSPPTDLLDLVSINYPLVVRPMPGKRIPFEGIAIEGDTATPFPYTEGALVIDMGTAWKVIEIRENPTDFTSVLKLRVRGSAQTDGTFQFLLTEGGLLLETETGEYLQA